MADKLTGPLQESVLALICFNDEQGGVAAGLVDPELFEPPYDAIVKKALTYRKRFKESPGEAHIDDLFDDVLSDKKNKSHALYQHVLGAIIEQSRSLNPAYVLSRVSDFMDHQNVLACLYEAADRMERGGDDSLAETKAIMHKGLRFKPDDFKKGVYLSDKKNIELLTSSVSCDYYLGVDQFDKIGFGLSRGKAFGFTANQGRGKTWSCVHAGIMGLLQGARVLHISLEMDETQIIPRYIRRLFAIAKRADKYRQTKFDLDELQRVTGFSSKMFTPRMALDDPNIEKKVARKMHQLGGKLNRLHFKSFPTKSLSHQGLIAYLDQLEATDGFIPDILILDYFKLMRISRRGGDDLRIGLGEQMEELRGLCGERFMAGYFPFQANRSGEKAALLTASHVGEDYSLIQTVDDHVTYNQTDAEEALGLARLYVDKARSEKKHYTILITQDYETGRFVKQSAYMPTNYWQLMKTDEEESAS